MKSFTSNVETHILLFKTVSASAQSLFFTLLLKTDEKRVYKSFEWLQQLAGYYSSHHDQQNSIYNRQRQFIDGSRANYTKATGAYRPNIGHALTTSTHHGAISRVQYTVPLYLFFVGFKQTFDSLERIDTVENRVELRHHRYFEE